MICHNETQFQLEGVFLFRLSELLIVVLETWMHLLGLPLSLSLLIIFSLGMLIFVGGVFSFLMFYFGDFLLA